MRLIIIPVLVLYFISKAISGEKILVFIFVCFGILWVILALFLLIKIKKTPVFSAKKIKLALKEKKQVNSFFVSLVLFSIFSIIFSYTDILLLGGFVSLEYIGYYQVAMGLVGSLSTLVLFSGSLFPVFSSMKGDALESGFNRTLKITFIISFVMCAGVLLFSKVIIEMLYGQAYLQAVPFFRELCLLLILLPFTSLYGAYFIAKGKPEIIKNLLIFVSLFNLGLNFLVVYFFSQYSYSYAVFGLISGTVFSNIIYLIGCILKKNKSF
jgi:O-antigen/teichoic acid export membrane protein